MFEGQPKGLYALALANIWLTRANVLATTRCLLFLHFSYKQNLVTQQQKHLLFLAHF